MITYAKALHDQHPGGKQGLRQSLCVFVSLGRRCLLAAATTDRHCPMRGYSEVDAVIGLLDGIDGPWWGQLTLNQHEHHEDHFEVLAMLHTAV